MVKICIRRLGEQIMWVDQTVQLVKEWINQFCQGQTICGMLGQEQVGPQVR